jgi:hypothetical protein
MIKPAMPLQAWLQAAHFRKIADALVGDAPLRLRLRRQDRRAV